MIPLGAIVRWKDVIYKSAWSGVVTGHPRPGMIEVGGRGAISEGLLEVVEKMASQDALEGLTTIVAQQCEIIASMTADASEFRRLQAVEEDFDRLRDAVSDALLALTGTRRPSQRDCAWPELWKLAEAAEYFED